MFKSPEYFHLRDCNLGMSTREFIRAKRPPKRTFEDKYRELCEATARTVSTPTVCAICMEDAPARVALVPCGHSAFCRPCANNIRNNRCPICRSNVWFDIQLY
ncbi:MAG: hypothetical protein CMA10_04840 [Euryarchaeota archaeon]|nr:hypothetical protein [Euryarchaeota archaeon]